MPQWVERIGLGVIALAVLAGWLVFAGKTLDERKRERLVSVPVQGVAWAIDPAIP